MTPSRPAGSAHLVLPCPLSPFLTHGITFLHSCRACFCRAYVQLQDTTSLMSILENLLPAQVFGPLADRSALSQKRLSTQHKHNAARQQNSFPTKYLDQYQPIARAVSSLVRDLVSQGQEHKVWSNISGVGFLNTHVPTCKCKKIQNNVKRWLSFPETFFHTMKVKCKKFK